MLHRIRDALGRLARDGDDAVTTIDLNALPMSSDERQVLVDALGEGEVDAQVCVAGVSHVRETRFPGVWWIRHLGRRGELLVELVEVTRVPTLLATHRDDLGASRRALAEQLVSGLASGTRP